MHVTIPSPTAGSQPRTRVRCPPGGTPLRAQAGSAALGTRGGRRLVESDRGEFAANSIFVSKTKHSACNTAFTAPTAASTMKRPFRSTQCPLGPVHVTRPPSEAALAPVAPAAAAPPPARDPAPYPHAPWPRRARERRRLSHLLGRPLAGRLRLPPHPPPPTAPPP